MCSYSFCPQWLVKGDEKVHLFRGVCRGKVSYAHVARTFSPAGHGEATAENLGLHPWRILDKESIDIRIYENAHGMIILIE